MSARRKKRRHILIRPMRNGLDDPYKRYLESTSQHRERFTLLMEQIDGSKSREDKMDLTESIEVKIGKLNFQIICLPKFLNRLRTKLHTVQLEKQQIGRDDSDARRA